MLKRIIIIACLFTTAALSVSAQGNLEGTRLRLVDDGQTYGAILIPPTPAGPPDIEYRLPDVGGYLMVGDGTGNPPWFVGGQSLTATGLIGSKNAFDVHLVVGPSLTPRVILPSASKLVILPNQTEIRFYEPAAGGTEYSAFKADATTFDMTIFLPSTVGPADSRLSVVSNTANTTTTTWLAP